ncbi:DUF2242 domain-containing protein [Marilutibacter aestuarii]|uniref:DUF2242 domain-containing protein n=1 Tax=Marilutibacter aestuarii TaxID=1706195 RepID=A0A508A9T3_9GAMM|nr:DUF2242 domain-containing protein [Lysobacter aestuarii]TQD45291.1 DUF2242 domain-containing protein [Lysobacter aestuarii]
MQRARSPFRALAVLGLAATLAACGFNRKSEPPPLGETFGADDTYSRTYAVPPATACEATRRALLGQGYVIGKNDGDTLQATKSFQPESDIHTQLKVRATCLAQPGGGAIVFVNAVQDRYVLNTSVKSASVGVSMIGSVSLPIGTSGGDLVRVATNTVQNQDFYRRFFERVAAFIPSTEGLGPAPPPAVFETLPDPEPPAPLAPLVDPDAPEPR